MRGQRLCYLGAIAAMFAGVAIVYLVPWICQEMLDAVIAGKILNAPRFVKDWIAEIGGQSVLAQNIWIASVAIVIVSCISGFFMYVKGRGAAIAAEAIARSLRETLYFRLQHAPCGFHDRMNTGDLVQRCTSDVETVRNFLSSQVLQIVHALVLLITVLPIMLSLDARMTLVSLAIIPPIVGFSIVFFIKIKSAFTLSDEAEGKMSTALQENLTGIRVVRAFARQEHECEKFAVNNCDYRDKVFRLIVLLAWFWSLSDVLCLLQKGLVLFAGAYWALAGNLSIGTFYAFFVYVNMYLWPVRNMGRILTETGKTLVSLGRLDEILSEKAESAGDRNTTQEAGPPVSVVDPVLLSDGAPISPPPRICFENVSFSHTTGKPVLDGVSFCIDAGKTLAILGPSGSGKTTLLQMLLRLYEPSSGAITLGGRDIREIDRKVLRRQMGVVLQEPFLFSKTVKENIRIGRSQAQDEEVFQAAADACIDESIRGFDKGYDTVVGERGVTLSGGQRQRMAIARAVLKEPAILILDDALSAVDTETEALILNALKSRHGRHTTLVVAHRLSTLMHADKIVVLEHGRTIQTGTHATLAKEDGLYRRLWNIQAALEDDLRQDSAEPANEMAAGMVPHE